MLTTLHIRMYKYRKKKKKDSQKVNTRISRERRQLITYVMGEKDP